MVGLLVRGWETLIWVLEVQVREVVFWRILTLSFGCGDLLDCV